MTWRPGDWLRAKGSRRSLLLKQENSAGSNEYGNFGHYEWVIVGDGQLPIGPYTSRVYLIPPNGTPVLWDVKQAQHLYAVARPGYRRYSDRPLPEWIFVGARLSDVLRNSRNNHSVYIVEEIRGQWVRLNIRDQPGYRIYRREDLGRFTPHLSRFQRDLDL